MNPRADEGTIVSEHSKNVIIYDKEIKERIAKISGSAFELLKKQLDDKRNALLSELKIAEAIESKTPHFYSTKLLQQKLKENFQAALDYQNLENPIEYLRQKCLKDYSESLKKLEQEYAIIKEKVRINLEISTGVSRSMPQLETPLQEKIKKLKSDLIETLQNAAAEIREYFISTKEWPTKIPEFTDIFGGVTTTYGGLQPDIDRFLGYGLQCGHVIRESKNGLPKPLSINDIKKMELKDIEKMINQVIQESLFKPYAQDTYKVHTIIKSHFEKLAKQRPKDNYEDDSKDFEFQENGTFYKYLSSFRITKKESELFDAKMNFHKQKLIALENDHDQEVAEHIHAVLKTLRGSVEKFKNTTDADILLVSQACKQATDFFEESATALYKDIESSHLKMKFVNSDAKTTRLAIDTSTHKAQLAYEDSIKAAKLLDESSFKKQSDIALDQIVIAHQKKQELEYNIKELEKYERSISDKLTSASRQFEGNVHKIFQAKYGREIIRFTKLKADAVLSRQYIEEADQLPKAIKIYGDFTFDYARSRFSIKEATQEFEKIPAAIQVVWTYFKKMLDDAQAKINFRFEDFQKSSLQQINSIDELVKKGNENLDKAREFQLLSEKKLGDAKTQFPEKIHMEHQENYEILQMELVDIFKRRNEEVKNFDKIKSLPDAINEYGEILYKVSLMCDEAEAVDRSSQHISNIKEELVQVENQAKKSREAGVIQQSLEEKARLKLDQSRTFLEKAAASLKMAEAIKLSEAKAMDLAKRTYPYEMHKTPQEWFDSACTKYSSALTSYERAEKDLKMSEGFYDTIRHEIKHAAIVEKEKQLSSDIRHVLLKAILFNLEVWPGQWGGGVDFQFMGKMHRIPHGVYELICAIYSSADHNVWIANTVKVASDRDELGRRSLKYMFKIRNDSTAALYRTIKNHLKLNEKSLELLTQELNKIPGLADEKKSIQLRQ